MSHFGTIGDDVVLIVLRPELKNRAVINALEEEPEAWKQMFDPMRREGDDQKLCNDFGSMKFVDRPISNFTARSDGGEDQ